MALLLTSSSTNVTQILHYYTNTGKSSIYTRFACLYVFSYLLNVSMYLCLCLRILFIPFINIVHRFK